jgi:hypothetical protein
LLLLYYTELEIAVIEQRLQLHIREFEAGTPLTKFSKKIIYFFDEISDLAQWAHNLGDPDVVEFLRDNDFPLDEKEIQSKTSWVFS